jgi:hypothetical protein
MEIWKDIIGYEGLYQVSNLGRVKSVARYTECNKGLRYQDAKIIKQSKITVKQRYPRVSLYKNNKRKGILVHRLVAQAFIPNPNNYPYVLHINHNPANYHVTDLEWGTQSENIKQCYNSGRRISKN